NTEENALLRVVNVHVDFESQPFIFTLWPKSLNLNHDDSTQNFIHKRQLPTRLNDFTYYRWQIYLFCYRLREECSRSSKNASQSGRSADCGSWCCRRIRCRTG